MPPGVFFTKAPCTLLTEATHVSCHLTLLSDEGQCTIVSVCNVMKYRKDSSLDLVFEILFLSNKRKN